MDRMEWAGDWRTDLIHPPHKGAGVLEQIVSVSKKRTGFSSCES